MYVHNTCMNTISAYSYILECVYSIAEYILLMCVYMDYKPAGHKHLLIIINNSNK